MDGKALIRVSLPPRRVLAPAAPAQHAPFLPAAYHRGLWGGGLGNPKRRIRTTDASGRKGVATVR